MKQPQMVVYSTEKLFYVVNEITFTTLFFNVTKLVNLKQQKKGFYYFSQRKLHTTYIDYNNITDNHYVNFISKVNEYGSLDITTNDMLLVKIFNLIAGKTFAIVLYQM